LLLQGYGAIEFSDSSNLCEICDTQFLNALLANIYKAMILKVSEFYVHTVGMGTILAVCILVVCL